MKARRGMAGSLALALAPALAVALAGCSENALEVDSRMAALAGSYRAEGTVGAVLVTTQVGDSEEVVDWLEAGASILLELRADGTTAGNLFVPGADDDGDDLEEDLAGTWILSVEGVVHLDHEADTILRDLPFVEAEANGDRLVGERTEDETTVRVELVRNASPSPGGAP